MATTTLDLNSIVVQTLINDFFCFVVGCELKRGYGNAHRSIAHLELDLYSVQTLLTLKMITLLLKIRGLLFTFLLLFGK